MLDLTKLSNFRFSEEAYKEIAKVYGNAPMPKLHWRKREMTQLLWEICTTKPQWTAEVSGVSTSPDYVACGTVHIYEGTAKLGDIGTDYYRNDYVFRVEAERTPRKRTTDAKRALSYIRKNFYAPDLQEKLRDAADSALSVLRDRGWQITRKLNEAKGTITPAAIDYVLGPQREAFLRIADEKITKAFAEYDEQYAYMTTIEQIKNKFDGLKDAALVVIDAGKYVVKTGDRVDLYDDTTLPVSMRGKIGMLKLVSDEQCVSDVGCRVSSEVFIVVNDDATQA